MVASIALQVYACGRNPNESRPKNQEKSLNSGVHLDDHQGDVIGRLFGLLLRDSSVRSTSAAIIYQAGTAVQRDSDAPKIIVLPAAALC
jgi:hypothetical protein